jgi:methylmalonyl-CoA mutase C-terminal domain/subunit
VLSGAHLTLVPKVVRGLAVRGIDDVLVIAGGTIPDDDRVELLAAGVAAVFTPGTTTTQIVEFVRGHVSEKVL